MKIYTHPTKNDLTVWAPIRLGGPNKIWGPGIDLRTPWKIFSLRPCFWVRYLQSVQPRYQSLCYRIVNRHTNLNIDGRCVRWWNMEIILHVECEMVLGTSQITWVCVINKALCEITEIKPNILHLLWRQPSWKKFKFQFFCKYYHLFREVMSQPLALISGKQGGSASSRLTLKEAKYVWPPRFFSK